MTFRPICIIGRNKLLKACESKPVPSEENAIVSELILLNWFIINVILGNTPETLEMSIVSDFPARSDELDSVYLCKQKKIDQICRIVKI
jgi:hypothetical protein